MPIDAGAQDLRASAQELVDAVAFDDSGALIAGTWRGGNGGLLSRETMQKADACRRAIAAFDLSTEKRNKLDPASSSPALMEIAGDE